MRELTDDEKGWIVLHECCFSSGTTGLTSKIYKYVSRGSDILNYEDHKDAFIKILGIEKYNYLVEMCSYETLVLFENKNLLNGIGFLTIESVGYPKKLKEMSNPPIILFYIGDVSLLDTKSIAIVGTRATSNYGANITKKFATELAQNGLTIVSGLAEGVDTFAHSGALEAGGKTIAVLAGGLKKIYPVMNQNLAKEIAKKGLIVTEYSYSTEFMKYNFPFRNRIIAGLSEGVLVTEASAKSGSRYTVQYAMEMNRNIYAIPGNITSYKSDYPNRLIKGCNACMVMEPKDILSDLNCVFVAKNNTQVKQMDLTESMILDIIKDGEEVYYYEIQEKTQIEISKLNGILLRMELMGLIVQLPGNKYRIN